MNLVKTMRKVTNTEIWYQEVGLLLCLGVRQLCGSETFGNGFWEKCGKVWSSRLSKSKSSHSRRPRMIKQRRIDHSDESVDQNANRKQSSEAWFMRFQMGRVSYWEQDYGHLHYILAPHPKKKLSKIKIASSCVLKT